MPDWRQFLEQHVPNWHERAFPGEEFLWEGEQALTSSTPSANTRTSLIERTLESYEVAIVRRVTLKGEQLVAHPGFAGNVYEELAPSAIRGKLTWRFYSSKGDLVKAESYDEKKAWQRLRTIPLYSTAASPDSTVKVELTMIDPSVGASVPSGGAVLTATVEGFLIDLRRFGWK